MPGKTTKKDQLVQKISKFIRRFVVLPQDELTILSHYVLHTHQFSERCEQPYTTPYIYIHSAQKGSGKTLLGIDILGMLTRNFQGVNNVTPATLFRLTETRCTLGIDEVDMLFSGGRSNDDLVSIMNTGYRKGGYVPRYDSKAEGQVRHFSTFGPKILIGIDNGLMKDTTRDRCIPIHIDRATDAERATVERFYSYKVEDELDELMREIYAWSFNNTQGMRAYEPVEMTELSPRQWEICMPLLQVAKLTGYESEVRDALRSVFEEHARPENTAEMDMLTTIRDMFEEGDTDKLMSKDIIARLQGDPRFRSWNGKMLATRLAPFNIRVKPVRFPVHGPQRGITMEDCHDAFARYL